ncbi:MAG TPA: MauE/DoxX family redox-associated membrane protein [Puia sp.]|nr:MauE/DoxX family redox-associated membrane protein [Puia sp.]
MKRQKWIADICAFALVFLFVYTASSKFLRLDIFAGQLERFPWISPFASLMAWVVPGVEVAVAVLLLTGRIRLLGFSAALGLMLLFTVYLALMLGSDRHLPCSCGGVISWMTWKQHLVFNLFFIGVALAGLVYSSPKIKFYESKT